MTPCMCSLGVQRLGPGVRSRSGREASISVSRRLREPLWEGRRDRRLQVVVGVGVWGGFLFSASGC